MVEAPWKEMRRRSIANVTAKLAAKGYERRVGVSGSLRRIQPGRPTYAEEDRLAAQQQAAASAQQFSRASLPVNDQGFSSAYSDVPEAFTHAYGQPLPTQGKLPDMSLNDFVGTIQAATPEQIQAMRRQDNPFYQAVNAFTSAFMESPETGRTLRTGNAAQLGGALLGTVAAQGLPEAEVGKGVKVGGKLTNAFWRKMVQGKTAIKVEQATKALYSGGIETVNRVTNVKSLVNFNKVWVKAGTALPEAAQNTKTVTQAQKILKTVFSTRTMAIAGSYAGAVFLGMWGQAEADETIGFVKRDTLIPYALQTGDWSLVREAEAAEAEISDLNTWERLSLWTPLAPLTGIGNKIKAIATAKKIEHKVTQDLEENQQNNESEEEYWARRDVERAAMEKEQTDYQNSERLRVEKELAELDRLETLWREQRRAGEREAIREEERAFMEEQRQFWLDYQKELDKMEAENRMAIAEFWLNYKKEVNKIQQDNSPSTLNFGLI